MTTIEKKINTLISGGVTSVSDSELLEIRQRLRDIKNNCTIVLSQLKERIK